MTAYNDWLAGKHLPTVNIKSEAQQDSFADFIKVKPMNISDIEKVAKLMYGDFARQMVESGFNPRTNKADLVDVECELSNICVIMNYSMCIVTVDKEDGTGDEWEASEYFSNHPNKFTARAHAVMAVVEQIYDAKFGKDGE